LIFHLKFVDQKSIWDIDIWSHQINIVILINIRCSGNDHRGPIHRRRSEYEFVDAETYVD
jgi:hypothetical protein